MRFQLPGQCDSLVVAWCELRPFQQQYSRSNSTGCMGCSAIVTQNGLQLLSSISPFYFGFFDAFL